MLSFKERGAILEIRETTKKQEKKKTRHDSTTFSCKRIMEIAEEEIEHSYT